jgi:hypothetical protein
MKRIYKWNGTRWAEVVPPLLYFVQPTLTALAEPVSFTIVPGDRPTAEPPIFVLTTAMGTSAFGPMSPSQSSQCVREAFLPDEPWLQEMSQRLAARRPSITWGIPIGSDQSREMLSALVSKNAPAPSGVTDADTSTDEAWEAGVHGMIAEAYARREAQSR